MILIVIGLFLIMIKYIIIWFGKMLQCCPIPKVCP